MPPVKVRPLKHNQPWWKGLISWFKGCTMRRNKLCQLSNQLCWSWRKIPGLSANPPWGEDNCTGACIQCERGGVDCGWRSSWAPLWLSDASIEVDSSMIWTANCVLMRYHFVVCSSRSLISRSSFKLGHQEDQYCSSGRDTRWLNTDELLKYSGKGSGTIGSASK